MEVGKHWTSSDKPGCWWDRVDGGEERARRQRALCPSQVGVCHPLPKVSGLSLAFSQAWAWGGAGGPRRGLVL